MKPDTTAIVLIEYQNDFTTVGGVFHEGVKDVMQSNNMLANTVEVANKGRAAGATVMHAPISFAEGYGELTNHPYGILKGVVDNKAFRKGSWGAAIVDVLKPQPEDIVVEGKRGLDALSQHQPRFHFAKQGDSNRGAGRVSHKLLCGINHAQRLRTRVRRRNAEGLHGHAEPGGAGHGDGPQLRNVFASHES
jgi:nicotinamidase-related amidase